MKIAHWVGGLLGLTLLFLFLGKYAFSINSVPLWIIIVGCLVMPVADFVVTIREGVGDDEDRSTPK